MKKEYINYYINEERNIIGKCIGNNCFILKEDKWINDSYELVYGNKEKIYQKGYKDISYKEVLEIINDYKVNKLIDKWNNSFIDIKKEWNNNPLWYAKLVETRFELNNISYTIYPDDISKDVKYSIDGYMECIQKYMEDDLKEIGAINIRSMGFID